MICLVPGSITFSVKQQQQLENMNLEGNIGKGAPQNAWMTDKLVKMRKRTDFFTVLDSVGGIWRAIGNFPMCSGGSDNLNKFRFSNSMAVYYAVVFVTSLVFITMASSKLKFLSRMDYVILAITATIRIFSSVLCFLMNMLIWIFYRKDFIDAMDFLAAQNLILHQLGCRPDYSICHKMIGAYVYGTLMIVVALTTYDCYYSMKSWASESLLTMAQWFFCTLPSVMQMMTPTIFGSLVVILGLHFRELNTKLVAIRDRSNSSPPKVIELSNDCAEGVRLVAKVHYNLCKIAKFINWIFNGFFVVIVATAFVILSSSLYFIFNEVVRPEDTNYLVIGNYICWQIATAFPIIATVIICNWTSNEAEYTGKLIHEIHVDTTESQLYQIIRSLSLQLHHQKMEFSGAGLFPINSSLLQTMIGNMTTSLVILIQFQPSLA